MTWQWVALILGLAAIVAAFMVALLAVASRGDKGDAEIEA